MVLPDGIQRVNEGRSGKKQRLPDTWEGGAAVAELNGPRAPSANLVECSPVRAASDAGAGWLMFDVA